MSLNILVTGGAGYIGSHICQLLAYKGYTPIVLDNLSTGFRELVKYGDFIEGDTRDKQLLEQIFVKHDIVAVIHLAAYKSAPESIFDPYKYYNNNVFGTNELLKTMVENNIKNFIFSSSAAIFGLVNDTGKITENCAKSPINPYGMSKLMVENILSDYDEAYDLKFTSLRYFNVMGSDSSLEIGDMDENNTNLLNSIFRAIGNKQEFKIYGENYETKDGSCIRDYIHVCDLAEAHILALEKQLQTNNSMKINLGNGNGFSVKEIVQTAKEVTSVDFKVTIEKKRQGDPAVLVADSTLASKYLGWKASFTDVEKQISHSWNWYKKLKNI